jgi:hypothetical protein
VHWDLACERLMVDQLWQLRRWTDWQLAATNARLAQESAAISTSVPPPLPPLPRLPQLPQPREQPAPETGGAW